MRTNRDEARFVSWWARNAWLSSVHADLVRGDSVDVQLSWQPFEE
jgi:hypothetical protein